jgi:GSCFA family
MHKLKHTCAYIVHNTTDTIASLRQVILTVSPVRHLKDGAVESSRSRAHILSAVHAAIDTSNTNSGNSGNSAVTYFPSLELVLDDLRDYR